MRSEAQSVDAYLAELDPADRLVVSAIRDAINAVLPDGFVEIMDWGMISWVVPLTRYPKTYNKKPLLYCSLARQKQHFSLYLMQVYAGSRWLAMLEEGYAEAGVKLTMGKSCLRFKRLDAVHLPTISAIIADCSVADWISTTEAARQQRGGC